MKNHSEKCFFFFFFYHRCILSVGAPNNLFSTKRRHVVVFSFHRGAPIKRVTPRLVTLCAVQNFFRPRYSPLCSTERLIPEWMNECPGFCECLKKKKVSLFQQCVDSATPTLLFSLRLSFGSILKPFYFWDFLWHVSAEAFPLRAGRCNAWYSCQCFWCTPCNRRSWDSITLSASWGKIFSQRLKFILGMLLFSHREDPPALHGMREPLCACCWRRHASRHDSPIAASALIWFN